MNGPPSCGKTLLMRALKKLLSGRIELTELILKSSSYRILQLDFEQYFKKGPGAHKNESPYIFELS